MKNLSVAAHLLPGTHGKQTVRKFHTVIIILALLLAIRVEGQSRGTSLGGNLTLLYSFPKLGAANTDNSDGAWPSSGVVVSPDGLLYGLTSAGGEYGQGTVFSIDPLDTNADQCTDVYDFAGAPVHAGGIYPKFGLVIDGDVLYGTTYYGGSADGGTIFSVHTDGTDFRTLHNFQPKEGVNPVGNLLVVGDAIFGTTYTGGAHAGALFCMGTDGSDFTAFHIFQSNATTNEDGEFQWDLTDGANPACSLALSEDGTTLCGTTMSGGSETNGTVFAVDVASGAFHILHSFSEDGEDGNSPVAGLVLSEDGILYGATYAGGKNGLGTAFSINTDGTDFNAFFSFSPNNAQSQLSQAKVTTPMVLSDNAQILYGTAVVAEFPFIGAGYTSGGSLFALAVDGSAFSCLHAFGTVFNKAGGAIDGAVPDHLCLAGNTLYGAAAVGGGHNHGNVFSLQIGLEAEIAPLPRLCHIGDTITVVTTVLDNDSESISNVSIGGEMLFAGTGEVIPVSASVPPINMELTPLGELQLTNVFSASNWGTVDFSAIAMGFGGIGKVTSQLATSPTVMIAPKGDLLLKRAQDAGYVGAGIYQMAPATPQILTNAVTTNQTATFYLEVVNNETNEMDYTLTGSFEESGWTNQYLLGGEDVTPDIMLGMDLPTLQAGESLTLTINTTTTNQSETESVINLTLGLASDPSLVVDAVQAVATVAPVPVTITLHRIQADGFTQESLPSGLEEIKFQLVPVTDVSTLAAQPIIDGGLVADDITPLLVEVSATASNLAAYPEGRAFTFAASTINDGELYSPLEVNILDLTSNSWEETTNFTLSATKTNAFVLLGPIRGDDVDLDEGELVEGLEVTDEAAEVLAGWSPLHIRKPPIFLLHDAGSDGDWDPGFTKVLGNSRPMTTEGDPGNFVVTIRYGQDALPPYAACMTVPVYENTAESLGDCAVMANNAMAEAKETILNNWAMTCYDVVGHGQGGVIARMLSSKNPNGKITAPFRNEDNFYRGRFHRVVTIGSPHNGSRLLYYLKALDGITNGADFNHTNLLVEGSPLGALVGLVGGAYLPEALAKFDPFGEQIQELNDPSPSGNWYPDPAAQFHLIRAAIAGCPPTNTDEEPMAYQVMDLIYPGAGGAVIPRGSDGVVDLDSMAANVPPAPLALNICDMTSNLFLCHSGPLWPFDATGDETVSTTIAEHVIDALDQNTLVPQSEIQFGPFPLPPLLGQDVKDAINGAAASVLLYGAIEAIEDEEEPAGKPKPMGGSPNVYSFHLNFPSNEPPVGNVAWFAVVYGTNGISGNGVNWMAQGANDAQVTVTVNNGLVGDVVLYACYKNASNQLIQVSGQLLVSQGPPGASLTGIGLLPWNPTLPVGSEIAIQIVALYSDGTSSLRYVGTNALTAASSDAAVVSTANPLRWELLSPGSAEVVVNWSGFGATNQVTAYSSASDLPALSVSYESGEVTLAWPLWAADFSLESNTSLLDSAWDPVALEPSTNGQYLNLTLPIPQGAAFFRLER
ncbi:MAG: choice-of-anchor tandem repeat GloVer-containing protein [Limisphaerales bacterium]